MARLRIATMAAMGSMLGLAMGPAPTPSAAEEPGAQQARELSQHHALHLERIEVAQNGPQQRSIVADDETNGSPPNAPVSAAPAREAADAIHYRPPSRGAPRDRVGGGTRTSGTPLSVQVLAPPHVALTLQSAPTLYWHIDRLPPEPVKIVFTLIDEVGIDPIASFELPRPEAPGIQPLHLAEHGVSLEPGVEYEWSIALVVDPQRRAHDIVSTAWLRRIDASDAAAPRTPGELAERSLWYDALAALSQEIASDPANRDLQAMRSALLRQAELKVQ